MLGLAGSVQTMDRFNGLEIPESLDEVLDPARLALVVYDMQVGILAQIAVATRCCTTFAGCSR